MNVPKIKIPEKITRAAHKASFQVKKHSPEILMVAGVAGLVTSAVVACCATRKLDAVLDQAKFEIDAIHAAKEKGEVVIKATTPDTKDEVVPYTEEDHNRDLAFTYLKNAGRIAVLYGPAVALGTASVVCIFASNGIMRKRNLALAAAYTAVDTGFKDYRSRVVERFGEELDKELRYNIKAHEVEETVVHEDGTEQTVKKTVSMVDDPTYNSIYSVYFAEGNPNWVPDAEANRKFLQMTARFANEKLRAEGYLYLNDLYEMLGFNKTKAGQVVGWVFNEKDPIGDNFIDIGIFDVYRAEARDFINHETATVLLDFNVDGNIWDLMV